MLRLQIVNSMQNNITTTNSTHIAYEDQLAIVATAFRLRLVGRVAFDKKTNTPENGLLVDPVMAVRELSHHCDIPVSERRLETALSTFKHLAPPFPAFPPPRLRRKRVAPVSRSLGVAGA